MLAASPCHDMLQLPAGETKILPNISRAIWTVQQEHCFLAPADHMHMGGPVIVRIDHHSQAIKIQHRWQSSFPQR